MQKTHMKLGLLIAIACLFLMAGTFTSASAHTVQSAKKFHHWFLQTPHITVKLLSTSGRHSKNAYTGRALIYGVGFHATNGYSPCDSCGSSMTTTTTSSTTTTSTTTTSPTCPSDCGSSTPVSTSTTCSSYSSCSGNAPAGPSTQPGPSTTCSTSYSSCSGSAPAGPSNQSGPSYNDCGCNTVDLQSSAPISAYTPGTNLSQVPVNAFGEFRVIVNVRPSVRHYYTVPTVWAVNTYNDQPSNSAPMCYCS